MMLRIITKTKGVLQGFALHPKIKKAEYYVFRFFSIYDLT